MTSSSLWVIARLPMEIDIVGPRVTLVRLASALVFPSIVGLIARTFFARPARRP